jgi:hypothetical protein
MMLFVFMFVIVLVLVLILVFGNPSKPDVFQIGQQKYFFVTRSEQYINIYPLNKYPGECFDFYIAGINHSKYADSHLGEFMGELRPEPSNPYDGNAIMIVDPDGQKLGYVPKDLTGDVRRLRELPCVCFCYIARYNGKYFTRCFINTPGNH